MINKEEISRIIDKNDQLSATTKADLKSELTELNNKILKMKKSIAELKQVIKNEDTPQDVRTEKMGILEQFEINHSGVTETLNSFFQLLSNSGM